MSLAVEDDAFADIYDVWAENADPPVGREPREDLCMRGTLCTWCERLRFDSR